MRNPKNYNERAMAAAAQHLTMRITSSTSLQSIAPEVLASLQRRMANVGLLGKDPAYTPGLLDDDTVAAIQTLERYSKRTGEAQLDVLSGMEATGGMYGPDQGHLGGDGGEDPAPTTTTTVNLTDPTTAKVVSRQTLRQELGRAPTDSEYKAFQAGLNQKEKLYPQVTTTDYDDEGNAIVTNSGDQAPTPEVFADEFVRHGKLGKERNTKLAAVDFYGAAMSRLGAGGLGGPEQTGGVL